MKVEVTFFMKDADSIYNSPVTRSMKVDGINIDDMTDGERTLVLEDIFDALRISFVRGKIKLPELITLFDCDMATMTNHDTYKMTYSL